MVTVAFRSSSCYQDWNLMSTQMLQSSGILFPFLMQCLADTSNFSLVRSLSVLSGILGHWCTSLISVLGKHKQVDPCLGPAWSAQRVSGQPGLHTETLYQYVYIYICIYIYIYMHPIKFRLSEKWGGVVGEKPKTQASRTQHFQTCLSFFPQLMYLYTTSIVPVYWTCKNNLKEERFI